MGTQLALVSSHSQIRHPEGKHTLTTAPLISASQPVQPGASGAHLRRAPAMPPDELSSAAQPELYSASRFN